MLGFEEFFRSEYPRTVRLLGAVFHDHTLSEDLAQDAFARALSRWRRVSAMESPAAWVYVTAVRAGRRRLGREATAPRSAPASTDPDPMAAVGGGVDLRDRLASLPPRQRAVVLLRVVGDLSTREVAEALGCAEGTVKASLHAGLAALRTELTEVAGCVD